MKKILYVLSILLLCNISMVKALDNNIYYSNYGEWSEYSKDNYSETELMDVEVERRYKWFKNKERGEYLNYDEGIKIYDNINKDDYKYSDYSDWQENNPEEITDRVIETQKKYFVKKIKPVNKLYILSGRFKTDKVNLNQIEIFNNGKKITFSTICGGCSDNYKLDNISGLLILEFDDFYYFDDLKIVITSTELKNINSLSFWVTSSVENSNEDKIFYKYTYYGSSDNSLNLDISKFSKSNFLYEEGAYYDELPALRIDDYKEEIISYRYKDTLYYFYSYDKEYIDGYFKEKEGYEKDINNYIDYYRYRTRDKIEFSNYVEINKSDELIDDYINSTVDYEIEGNIDYTTNDLYHVKVKTYFLTKDMFVFVNIDNNNENITDNKENTLAEEKTDSLNNNEQKEIILDEQLLNKYKALEIKYNELLKEKSEEQNTSEVIENNICKEELEKVTLKNDDNEKKLKLSNQAYDYLNSLLLKINNNDFELGLSWYLWLFFLMLLLLLIIIILKKRKNKNNF